MRKCETRSCTREATVAGLCSPCYSGMHYWMKRGIKAVMRRKAQLRVLDDRLDNLRPVNVVHIRKRA